MTVGYNYEHMYSSYENCETNWGKKIDLIKNVEA